MMVASLKYELFEVMILKILKPLFVIIVMVLVNNASANFSEEVIQDAKDSSVFIIVEKGIGSGFVVSARGYVVTNYHVVDGSNNIECLIKIGSQAYLRKARVVGVKQSADLAILKVESMPEVKPMVVGVYKPVSSQEVMAIGFPRYLFDGIRPLIRRLKENGDARVSEKERDELDPATSLGNIIKIQKYSDSRNNFDAITHDATISGGNSGGALIDKAGNVIGINVAVGRTKGPIKVNYNYAIRSSELIQFAGQQGIKLLTTSQEPQIASPSADTGPKNLSLIKTLLISIALLVIVLFVLVLRKPRTVIVNSVSRLTKLGKPTNSPQVSPAKRSMASTHSPRKIAIGDMYLRGRDVEGRSFEFIFNLQKIRASSGRLIIGRNPNLCQLQLRHDSVSGQHATITEKKGLIYVEDRNSGNGTYVNDHYLKLGETVLIKPGDHLVLGEVRFVFDQMKG